MAGLFEGIIDTLKEKRKEGKIQYGFRYNPDLKIGGGYYDDNKMFEVDVDRDGVNLMFKKKFAGGGLAEEYYGKDKLDWMENYSDQMTFEEYLRYKRSGSFANGGRIGFANGGDGDYIYTRPSGAKRLVIGDTIFGSVGIELKPCFAQNTPKSLKSDLYALSVLLALELLRFSRVSS